MKIPEKVDNCPVCEPIRSLLNLLLNRGFVIEKQECSDYHFHQLAFRIKSGEKPISKFEVNIDKIKKHETGIYYCECHWSTIEIIK